MANSMKSSSGSSMKASSPQASGMSSNTVGQQSIQCDVTSCFYNAQNSYCSLDSIQVGACTGSGDGTPESESMCASYRAK